MSALLRIAAKSLGNRRFTAAITVATIALSVMLLLGVERLRAEARTSFLRTVSGTDLIVGARAHPVQLLLYSVFHLGDATQNVSWDTYRDIAADPQVAWTVPVSLGDSHRGYRVVGTTRDYFEHLRYAGDRALAFADGRPFADVFEATIGADVARALGYAVGEEIALTHGTGPVGLHDHDDQPFRIVGVLAPTGTPIDRSVQVGLDAIEAIHLNWRSGTRVGQAPDREAIARMQLQPETITAFFVGLKTPVATFQLQRRINEATDEPLTAILPAVALQQLWGMVGVAERALVATAACVVAVGLLGMLTVLLATLSERRREMAILRSVGAGARHVFGLLLLEAVALSTFGAVLGLALLYAALGLGGGAIEAMTGVQVALAAPAAREWTLLAWIVGCGAAVGLVPALLAYRRSVADGMIVRH